MKTFIRFLVAFLAITGGVVLATGLFDVELGRADYWENHGLFFLVFITLFPRLTLLLSSVATGGWLWWLSWVFAPRLLVAVLATLAYWHQNPFLVVIAWLVAFGGESSEKTVIVRRGGFHHRRPDNEARGPSRSGGPHGYESAKWVNSEVEPRS